jgi:hypothetical protein
MTCGLLQISQVFFLGVCQLFIQLLLCGSVNSTGQAQTIMASQQQTRAVALLTISVFCFVFSHFLNLSFIVFLY